MTPKYIWSNAVNATRYHRLEAFADGYRQACHPGRLYSARVYQGRRYQSTFDSRHYLAETVEEIEPGLTPCPACFAKELV